ncbi:ThuA domain-containing protein [Rubrivirga litoralis]|uniref:ThuA domain-containing protein n=1 Tax=Rubrivirga litoralis TaxID=3075598 RepID=A0ABU3BLT3_9BACT|nr:ThuA domain-containing protein [Rubrivirga sp. F394]MDT0630252.1 ThuA domain-containing protein [Rubrivirga sp. F394]
MHRLALVLAVLVAGCATTEPEPAPEPTAEPRVLVFTKTAGYRHASIPDGVAALRALGGARGFEVDATEDSLAFAPERLAPYAAVVFLNTTGDVLGPDGEAALRAYVEGGGGWVGVHAASDTEYAWPWYGRLVGAYFESHPPVQEAALAVADADHPATRGLPARWMRTDEWYTFHAPPENVRVLLRLDGASYEGGAAGTPPAAWAHEVGRGRSAYTALGHTAESYAEPLFLAHLGGAVCWAARLDCAR